VLALADWLRSWQVPAVVMEATDYWKPVLFRLEAEGFGCVLAGARQVRNLPGRRLRRRLLPRAQLRTIFRLSS